MDTEKSLELLQQKLRFSKDDLQIPLLYKGQSFRARYTEQGVEVSNLANAPLLPWKAFEVTLDLLKSERGSATKGDAMKGKLGDKWLPLNSVEGIIASKVFDKKVGQSVFRRVTPVAALLAWAGLCTHKKGMLTLNVPPEAKAAPQQPAANLSPTDGLSYSNEFTKLVADYVSQYLSTVDYNAVYWKGKSWNDTIAFRAEHKLELDSSKEKLSEVLKWGGIHRFGQHHLYKAAVILLDENITPEKAVYERISSFSKLFSFYNPEKYFILDARVAFIINCIIESSKVDAMGIPFNFKIKSRNEILKASISLKELPEYFSDLGSAYRSYNTLVLEVFSILQRNGKLKIEKPELVEMVLFKAADVFFLVRAKV